MTSGDDGVLRGLNEGDERKSGHPDDADRWPRSRIYDADGVVVTFRSAFNTACMERNKTGLPANAGTPPNGEKETVCTQPPTGPANSPQTVPNGSFSPQNVSAGLNDAILSLS